MPNDILLALFLSVGSEAAAFFQRDTAPDHANDWESYLVAAGESPLLTVEDRRIYRMVYRPSWRSPLIVRLELLRAQPTLTVKVLDGQGAVRPGSLAREYTKVFGMAVWNELSDILRVGFWNQRPRLEGDSRIVDGSGCLIEASRWGEYYAVSGWNPAANGFRAVCKRLLKLTNEEVPATEFNEIAR